MERPPDTVLDLISSSLNVQIASVSPLIFGFSHYVFILTLADGRKWTLRIRKYDGGSKTLESSLSVIKQIKSMRQEIKIPAVIASTEMYTVLEYMDGRMIKAWRSDTLSRETRQKILDGLAVFFHELWTLPMPIVEQKKHVKTYRDHLLSEVDLGIRRSVENPGWGPPIQFLQRRIKLDELVPPQDDLGLKVKHGDLNAGNILIDEDGLTGVIDWDTVSYVPAPAAIHHPTCMANIPGFRNAPDDMDFTDDRAYLEGSIRKLSPDGSAMADMLNSSFERQFFEMALRNKRINGEYVRLRLEDATFDTTTLRHHLSQFLALHTDMASQSVILELQQELAANVTNNA